LIDLTKPKKGVVTSSAWIYCKDGHSYRAFFGMCQIWKAQDVIGCRTGSGQADFLIRIGTINPIILAGCQFHSFQLCDKRPGGNAVYEAE